MCSRCLGAWPLGSIFENLAPQDPGIPLAFSRHLRNSQLQHRGGRGPHPRSAPPHPHYLRLASYSHLLGLLVARLWLSGHPGPGLQRKHSELSPQSWSLSQGTREGPGVPCHCPSGCRNSPWLFSGAICRQDRESPVTRLAVSLQLSTERHICLP